MTRDGRGYDENGDYDEEAWERERGQAADARAIALLSSLVIDRKEGRLDSAETLIKTTHSVVAELTRSDDEVKAEMGRMSTPQERKIVLLDHVRETERFLLVVDLIVSLTRYCTVFVTALAEERGEDALELLNRLGLANARGQFEDDDDEDGDGS